MLYIKVPIKKKTPQTCVKYVRRYGEETMAWKEKKESQANSRCARNEKALSLT